MKFILLSTLILISSAATADTFICYQENPNNSVWISGEYVGANGGVYTMAGPLHGNLKNDDLNYRLEDSRGRNIGAWKTQLASSGDPTEGGNFVVVAEDGRGSMITIEHPEGTEHQVTIAIGLEALGNLPTFTSTFTNAECRFKHDRPR